MDPFDLPKEGSGEARGIPNCHCGADRATQSILMPLVADVRYAPLDAIASFVGTTPSLQLAAIPVRCCTECGTLFVIPEAHPTQ